MGPKYTENEDGDRFAGPRVGRVISCWVLGAGNSVVDTFSVRIVKVPGCLELAADYAEQ
jgi:hypothetical protein